MQDFVDDVVDFIRGVELAPCHLVGHSLGAMVALAVVVEHQELVRSLVVFGGSADDDAKFADGFRSLMALIERDGVTDQAVEAFTNICFGPRYREESPDGIAAYHDRLRTLDPKTIVEGLRAIAGRPSLEDRLATITIPTLVLHGDQDGRPASDAETIAHGIPGAELVRFPVGHTIQLEAPDAVNEALARFLRP
jgi:pimeloyl-ACP methyl ester carboxylesterase